MKKIILITFSILLYFSCNAQEKINLSKNYLSNSEYLIDYSFSSESIMKYKKPQDFLEYLKSQGIENPTIEKENYNLITETKTGKLLNNEFPLTINIIKSSLENYEGVKIYGENSKGKTKLNSIKSVKLNVNEKQQLFKSVSKIFNNEQLNKILTLNETLKNEKILNIPISVGFTVNLKVKTSYTFEKIENGIGYIKTNIKYELGSNNQKDLDIELDNSEGVGLIKYDLNNEYTKEYSIKVDLNIKMKIEEMELELNEKTEITQKTKKK